MDVKSSAFNANDQLPSEYTCEGASATPPLEWSQPPANAKTVAIVAEAVDPKTGKKVAHWIVTNVPTTTTSLQEGGSVPSGATEGKNSGGTTGYSAPCPPQGTQARGGGARAGRPEHVTFEVYAIDKKLDPKPMTHAQFIKAIDGHVVAQGEIVAVAEPKTTGKQGGMQGGTSGTSSGTSGNSSSSGTSGNTSGSSGQMGSSSDTNRP
jgi:Raf kinase inhibitor-like YbhB/YbcL family protein